MEHKTPWNNIGDMIKDHAKKFKDKPYLIYCEDNSKISFAEFDEITNKVANTLLDLGLKKGEKVSAILPNSLELLYAMFGAFKIGAVFSPMNINLLAEEYEYLINDSGSKVVFVDSKNLIKIEKIRKNLSSLKEIISIEEKNRTKGIKLFKDEIEKYSSELKSQNITLSSEALIIYSSGTTGKPKGVILTHENLITCSMSVGRFLSLKENTISLDSLPLFFIGGIMPTLFTTTCVGGTVVINKKFSKSLFWKRIEEYKINYTLLVPTMLSILLNPPEDISKYNLKSLKYILSSAAPLPVELMKKFEKEFNFNIFEAYGLTEDTAWVTMTPIDLKKRKPGSVGIAMDINEIKIVDDNDKEVPLNSKGEVLAKGSQIMKCYHNKPDLTKETLKNGWLHTGDIGYLDKNNYLYIIDRKKDLIIKGGENISPTEIDAVLYKHPNVVDAATIGIPDEMYGEEIKAFVVLKKGKKATETELIDFCQKHLAKHKCPKSISFIDKIPKGPSGKLLRRELIERDKDKS
ncbi:hypothetical protein CEE44_04740 [Candidatus Woesearchaeota archaeon B3_Woes]|nr:MAG: hypothetical protein CEE44_04740 [Candidatus Woesearchaeota archaeon B3_Woes]